VVGNFFRRKWVSERSEFHFQEKTFPTTAINPPKKEGYRFKDAQAYVHALCPNSQTCCGQVIHADRHTRVYADQGTPDKCMALRISPVEVIFGKQMLTPKRQEGNLQ